MYRPRTTDERFFRLSDSRSAGSTPDRDLLIGHRTLRAAARLWLLLASITACALPSRVRADDATLEEIRSGYIQSVTSWRAVWTRCQEYKTYSESMQADPKFADAAKRGAKGALVDWAVDGQKFHVSRRRPNGGSVSWFSYDGETTWTLDYADDGTVERARKRRLETKTDAGLTRNVNPGRFLGMYFNVGPILGTGVQLKSLLKTEPLTLVGREEVEGASCWKVEFAYPATSPDVNLPISVWFDPKSGYLPRRVTLELDGNAVGTSRVVEFQRVSTGDQVVSFPSEMTEEHPLETRTLTLLQIKLDDQVPDNLFRPTFPRGTPVYDLDDTRSANRLQAELEKPHRERVRAEMRAQAAARKEVNQARPVAKDGQGQIDAAVPRSRIVIWVLIGTGIVVLTLVTLHTRRAA